MVDMTSNAKHFAGDAQRRVATATEFGLNAFTPILHFQVSMLRMWADSIERLAGNYAKGADEVASTVKEQSGKEHAA
jgi:hypothetical protein